MRLQFQVTSIVVPRGEGLVVVGFDMGESLYGELPMTPEQAHQFASDILGAAVVASGNRDGPLLVTPDLLAVEVAMGPLASTTGTGRHHGLDLSTIRYDSRGQGV